MNPGIHPSPRKHPGTMAAIVAAIVVGLLALTGCEHMPKAVEQGSVTKTEKDGAKIENLSDYAAYVKTKSELANKPLFEMVCPAAGCVISSLKVNNPNAAGDIAAPAPPPKQESAFVGVMREVKETVLGLQPLGIAAVVGRSVEKMADRQAAANEAIAGKIQAPAANVTTTNTSTVNTANTNSGNTTTSTNSGNTATTTTTSNTATNSGATGTAKNGP